MLDTLLKIGQWQSEGASEWDRFLDKPKIDTADKKGNPIRNYTLPILFDLDEQSVVIDSGELREYREQDIIDLKNIKTLGGNNKAIYCTAPFKKLNQIYKTFFGKEGNTKATEGELREAIKKDFLNLKDSTLYRILENIFELKDLFLELSINEKGNLDPKKLTSNLQLTANENIVLLYTTVRISELGINQPLAIAKLPDYDLLVREKFIGSSETNNISSTDKKLCYASGSLENDVDIVNLVNRYSLNKMFVTETRNYASRFEKDLFKLNYQVSKANQEKLDYASSFLLQNYKIQIAGLDHVIVPQFLYKENLDFALILERIKKKSDILFSLEIFEEMVDDIMIETEDIFWINFIAYESDGNFFKTTELIKDVSHFHFSKVIQTFRSIHWEFKDLPFFNWDFVMLEYGKSRFFNLNSVYGLIPIRKEKEKKNKALELIKSILENRPVERSKLYKYFTELALCHYYGRYESYTNVTKSAKDYFRNAIYVSISRYFAFIEVLKQLNLITMDTENLQNSTHESDVNQYERNIQSFFERMALTAQQKAMFYLGRMLNTVANIQKDKKKTVIDKVNYNGMDKDDILRLRVILFEKAKQYGESRKLIFTDAKFGEYFDFERWNMDPNEAIFFILTGLTFGAKSNKDSNIS